MQTYNVVDAGHFFRRDPIAHAEDAGSMPTQGFRPYSNNVKPSYTGKRAAKAQLGVTGGFVEGADSAPTIDATWAKDTLYRASKAGNITGKNARKRAARKLATI